MGDPVTEASWHQHIGDKEIKTQEIQHAKQNNQNTRNSTGKEEQSKHKKFNRQSRTTMHNLKLTMWKTHKLVNIAHTIHNHPIKAMQITH